MTRLAVFVRLARTIPVAPLFVCSLAAQCPPGAVMPTSSSFATLVPTEGQAFARWQNGKDALAKNDLAAARTHLLAALEFHPSSAPMLADLLLACRGDDDQTALHVDRFVRAVTDARGQAKIDPAHRKLLAAVPGADARLEQSRALAQLRAAAIGELARVIDRNKPSGSKNATRAILVRHAADALLLAARGMPAQLDAVAANADKVQRALEPDQDVVVAGLARVMRTKPANSAAPAPDADAVIDRSLRAARVLAGLHRQGADRKVRGATVRKFDAVAEEARALLDAHAASLASAKVWTVAELEAMTPEERVRFTDEHANWRNPGIATSPKGRYRIETCCGHATLLATAQTIENHHARLVTHCGSDPFEQRQGLVRIVPEHADLETEGVPWWWAAGFQSGDRTTVRFAWSHAADLGRALTHELTHRFDNVLRAFAPSWFLEGHAEWTNKHYAKIADTDFVDDHLDVFTVAHTYYKGYASREQLEKLLKDALDEYRDNYFAGYSLYAFLRSWPPKAPRYREALAAWERNARAGQKDPIGWFTKCFCDGAAGRPVSLDAFLEQWGAFLQGCYDWVQDRKNAENAWVGEYGGRGADERSPLIPDAPTWSWARTREEPWYGQDHAAAAAALLHEAGDMETAVAAGVWSLSVDGWRADTCRVILAALAAGKASDVTAAFAALARHRFPALDARVGAAAPPRPVQLLLDGLAARAKALDGEGCTAAAAALGAEHDELAQLWQRPPLPARTAVASAPPRHMGEHGFTESELAGYDEQRTKGLWYVAADGDLHVGREKPREGTGSMDRQAQQRDAFVHTVEWQRPGAYVLRGRIQFTTSYARGAIVFGHWRRDRGLRLGFSTGSDRYASGKTEENEEQGQVHLSLAGLWERDGQLPDTDARPIVDTKDGGSWLEYALHVNGPRAIVEIDGKQVLRYAMHDGAPIEGAVGFAMSAGAIRVQQATVQRLDASACRGLDLGASSTGTLDDFTMLPVRGVPASRHGTFVLLVPKGAPDDTPGDRLQRHAPALLAVRSAVHEYPQPWILAVPRGLAESQRKTAAAAMEVKALPPMAVVEHDLGAPFDGSSPWILFVDGVGVLRAAAPVTESRWEFRVKIWAQRFRGR